MRLEDRIVPAQVALSAGALTITASPLESNALTIEVDPIQQNTLILREVGPGVTLSVSGGGLQVISPTEVRVATNLVSRVSITTGHEDDLGSEQDSVTIVMSAGMPGQVAVTGGAVSDRLTLVGTSGPDTFSLSRVRNAEGFKIVRVQHDLASLDVLAIDRLTLDLSGDGNDLVELDRYVSGVDRPLELEVIGGGAGLDSVSVTSTGNVPQDVQVTGDSIRLSDRVEGTEVFLGRSDNVAIDQPRIAVEVIDESLGFPTSLGPDFFNSMLLDTGATGIVFASAPTSELMLNGYQIQGQYLEQGVAGTTPMDVSAPYRFDFAGESGERNTIRNIRMLSSLDLEFSFFGPWGIVGMPTMVDRVTELNMSGWSTLEDIIDLYLKVDFRDTMPADTGHFRQVPLVLEDFPHDGQVGNDPVPTFAPLPFLDVVARDDGHTASGRFLLDTGAQLSLISTSMAIALGLDKNGNGSLDDEALDFIEVGGIGGTVIIPMVAFDQVAIPTLEGSDLIYTELFAGVLDIIVEDGPQFDGVFGMDFLTSGWADKILPLLLGIPGSDLDGYYSHVYFDFRNAPNNLGTMVLNLTADRDVVSPIRTHDLLISYTNLDNIQINTGGGDDQFSVSPLSLTTLYLNGGPHVAGDSLQLVPPGLPATDDGQTITVPGYAPIHYQAIESVDAGTSVPSLSIDNAGATEGGNLTFTVTLSAASSQFVTVDYATVNGTATELGDFTAVSGTLTFAPGVATQTIVVTTIQDSLVEGDETFTVVLSGATNAMVASGTGIGTILDDDAFLPVVIDDGDAGFVTAGNWLTSGLGGFQGDSLFFHQGTANQTATWTLPVVPGLSYRVFTTYPSHSSSSTVAPFTILDGAKIVSSESINQRFAPDDLLADGASWEQIGGTIIAQGSTLVVSLAANGVDGVVRADAVRVEPAPTPPPGTQILDDGSPGFGIAGDWLVSGLGGFQGDSLFSLSGNAGHSASWTFPVTPGQSYRVYATYPQHPTSSTMAPFTILDGVTVLSTTGINQRLAPNDLLADGAAWEQVGGIVTPTTGSLIVRLNANGVDGTVRADAIRIEPAPPPPAGIQVLDDGSPGFGKTGTWLASGLGGFQGDSLYAHPATPAQSASWTFQVTPGQSYRVYVTYPNHPTSSATAPFTILDGVTVLTTTAINQRLAPNDLLADGAAWEQIGGNVGSMSGLLTVRLDATVGDGVVRADAIRIEPAPPGPNQSLHAAARTTLGVAGLNAGDLSPAQRFRDLWDQVAGLRDPTAGESAMPYAGSWTGLAASFQNGAVVDESPNADPSAVSESARLAASLDVPSQSVSLRTAAGGFGLDADIRTSRSGASDRDRSEPAPLAPTGSRFHDRGIMPGVLIGLPTPRGSVTAFGTNSREIEGVTRITTRDPAMPFRSPSFGETSFPALGRAKSVRPRSIG